MLVICGTPLSSPPTLAVGFQRHVEFVYVSGMTTPLTRSELSGLRLGSRQGAFYPEIQALYTVSAYIDNWFIIMMWSN